MMSNSMSVLLGSDGNTMQFWESGMSLVQGATSGADFLLGTGGNDDYRALEGDDILADFGGGDRFNGGPGQDTILLDAPGRITGIFLTDRIFDVVVDLELRTQSDGGVPGDSDVVISIENYTHIGGFNYTIFGSTADNVLKTDRGVDVLVGRGGADWLISGDKNDNLDGGDGRDLLNGGRGNDVLSGGKGNDLLIGGRGADRFEFHAGHGDDRIRDFIDTGAMNDDRIVISRALFQSMQINSDPLGTLLDFGVSGSILLVDVMPDNVGRSDFLLV